MTGKEFFDLVRRMRRAQREFFATRDYTILQESKRLEGEVDREIDRVCKILRDT